MWVADTRNNRIQKPLAIGRLDGHHDADEVGRQQSFRAPWGVTFAPDGSIWVADTGNHRIVSRTRPAT